ncbi:MAG: zinc ribbon domain-containing protein [Deltaproteobacteria bacterium]|nr:zinc ribbon domain-containing protein [Deltaproteobacteria bacterium]
MPLSAFERFMRFRLLMFLAVNVLGGTFYLLSYEASARAVFMILGMSAILATLVWAYKMVAVLVAVDKGPKVAGPATGWRRRELEREKYWLLKAIKELEFDHQMNKISLEDFNEIAGRYRTRAVRVIRELDAKEPDYASMIEREIAVRVARAEASAARTGVPVAAAAAAAPAAAAPDKAHKAEADKADKASTDKAEKTKPEKVELDRSKPSASLTCSCGVVNDNDAEFCKKCGKSLTGAAS